MVYILGFFGCIFLYAVFLSYPLFCLGLILMIGGLAGQADGIVIIGLVLVVAQFFYKGN